MTTTQNVFGDFLTLFREMLLKNAWKITVSILYILTRMTESKKLLSPISNFQSSLHDVRSSVSGMALIGNIFSPIPSSVVHRDQEDDDNDHYTPQQSLRGTSESPILQSRIFDNVELDPAPKRPVERVFVETVDEESTSSIHFEMKRSSLVTGDRQSQDYNLHSPEQSPQRSNRQQSPLASSEYMEPNMLSDPTILLEYPDGKDGENGLSSSEESRVTMKDASSPRGEENSNLNSGNVARSGVTRSMENASSPSCEEKGHTSPGDENCAEAKCVPVANNIVSNKVETTFDVWDNMSNSVDDIRLEWEIASNEQPSHAETAPLNDSFASSGSNREEEIQQAQDALGATSLAFMDRLRGASHRRKMNLARSRDSLVNKEKAQREAVAASEAAAKSSEQESHSEGSYQRESKDRPDTCQFKARPLSKATLKSGGMSGVRFVEKRPVTTPCSPLLGARRQSIEPTTTTTTAKDTSSSGDEPCLFKALPWPRNQVENAGTYGVPKVEKRPTTVPESPVLGHRRRKEESSSSFSKRVLPTKNETKMPSRRPSMKGPPLNPKRFDQCQYIDSKENDLLPNNSANNTVPIDAFVPRSTQRASQRADYDVQRHEREQTRRIRKRRESLQQIKVLREELNALLSQM